MLYFLAASFVCTASTIQKRSFRPLFLFKNDHNVPLPVFDTFMNVFCAEYSTRAICEELRILIGKSCGRCVDKFVPKSVKWDKAGWIVNNKHAFFIAEKSPIKTQKSCYCAHLVEAFSIVLKPPPLYILTH
jgi:hypothetical protein